MASNERILTIHGIETSGDWQDELARAFAPHFACTSIKYPHYRWLGALKLILEPYVLVVLGLVTVALFYESQPFGWVRFWALTVLFLAAYLATYLRRTLAFNRAYRQASDFARADSQQRTHLIAHSLGTYLMGRALKSRPDVHVGRVVFVGCVLPRSFPWSALPTMTGDPPYRYLQVRNELGRKDVVVRLAWAMSWAIRGLGRAGFSGFVNSDDLVHTITSAEETCIMCPPKRALVHNVTGKHFGHSDAFVGSGYAETFWLPFLWGIEPREYQEFAKLCNLAAALERSWSSGARSAGHVDPRLREVEEKLLKKEWAWCDGPFGKFLAAELRSRFKVSDEELPGYIALAARGTWQAFNLGLEARVARQERIAKALNSGASAPTKSRLTLRPPIQSTQIDLMYDPATDEPITWLNPRIAIIRAVQLIP
jgi:pimeloyl-ACP methyl ester carboxylesterase